MEPSILFVDIETSPVLAQVWGLWDQNIALNQIDRDWNIISWAAKWADKSKVYQLDQRHAKVITNERAILVPLRELLDKADIMVAHNGKVFDHKKLNARFILNGIKPPRPYAQVDTLQQAKKHFAFTSNKLEYLADRLNKKYKKLAHQEYPGHLLWREVLKGNQRAWGCMAKYNIHDVLSLEEVYSKLLPWIKLPKIKQLKAAM